MTIWNLFSGSFTKEFVDVFESLRNSSNIWERNWVGGGTQSSGWKADASAPSRTARYSNGIERFTFDDSCGRLCHVGTVSGDIVNPQYLEVHPRSPVLYAAEYSRRGRLTCVTFDPAGQPGPLSTIASLGDLPIAVTVHPAGKYAYVAHFGDGTITGIALDAQGIPVGTEVVVRGDGRPDHPNFSRLHQVRSSPTGRAILVTDIGRDEVVAYTADGDGYVRSDPVARISFPARSGPRHMEFHPSGRYMYVVSERASCVYVMRSEEGIPTEILRSYSTVPPDYQSNNRPSELRLDPNGQCLYVGNRGFDSITIFAVGEDGALELLGYQASLGGNLSCLTVDPTGGYLIAGNVVPGTLVVFRITAGGRLEQTGEAVEAPAPRSFVFAGDGRQ